jgi:hypothetical protein
MIVVAGWNPALAVGFVDAAFARDAVAVEAFLGAVTGCGGLNCGPLRVVASPLAFLGGILRSRQV